MKISRISSRFKQPSLLNQELKWAHVLQEDWIQDTDALKEMPLGCRRADVIGH